MMVIYLPLPLLAFTSMARGASHWLLWIRLEAAPAGAVTASVKGPTHQ